MALSRGTEANFLYYWAKGRPDEDYHEPEVDQPQMKGLVAAVAHSRAQILAIDHLQTDVSATSGGLWLATGPRLR